MSLYPSNYECDGCGGMTNGGRLCPKCSERCDRGEIDEFGRPLLPVTLTRLSPGRWKAMWPATPHSIAHGLTGSELEKKRIKEIYRQVTMPNGKYVVELEIEE